MYRRRSNRNGWENNRKALASCGLSGQRGGAKTFFSPNNDAVDRRWLRPRARTTTPSTRKPSPDLIALRIFRAGLEKSFKTNTLINAVSMRKLDAVNGSRMSDERSQNASPFVLDVLFKKLPALKVYALKKRDGESDRCSYRFRV